MKTFLIVSAVLAGIAGISTHADARNFPWCAHFRGGGGRNCGFTTFHQCMDTVRGIGGICHGNPRYGLRR